jgi:hypothetical protein
LKKGELPMLYLANQVDEYIQRNLNNDWINGDEKAFCELA